MRKQDQIHTLGAPHYKAHFRFMRKSKVFVFVPVVAPCLCHPLTGVCRKGTNGATAPGIQSRGFQRVKLQKIKCCNQGSAMELRPSWKNVLDIV